MRQDQLPLPGSPGPVHAGVAITDAGRLMEGTTTKGDIAAYYAAVLDRIAPEVIGRPLTVLRCPSGVGDGCFYQRDPGIELGRDIRRYTAKRNRTRYPNIYLMNESALFQLVERSVVELHTWGASLSHTHHPDRLLFEIEPAPKVPFARVRDAALELNLQLSAVGLTSYVRSTGGKGLHVVVRLAAKDPWPSVMAFALEMAEAIHHAKPHLYGDPARRDLRSGKVLIDVSRNSRGVTAIADYSLRARAGLPVALPFQWSELAKMDTTPIFSMERAMEQDAHQRSPRVDVHQLPV